MARSTLRLSAIGWVIGVIIVIALLFSLGILGPVQRFAVRMLAPIGRITHSLVEGVDATLGNRQSAKSVIDENAILKDRVLQLELERAALNQQLVELKILRNEQAFLDRRSLKGVAVRVIGRSQANAQRLLVDSGSEKKIERGSPVLAGDGVLVGVVEDVQEGTCSVRLLTADSTNVAVRVRDQSGPPGVIVGERGVGIRLTLVPQNEKLEKNLAIITADADPQIPSGILVGTIATIDVAPGALFQSASLVPIVPLDRLNVLTIITSS